MAEKTHPVRPVPSRGYDDGPNTANYANLSVGQYIASRIPTLRPPFAPVPNPFKMLALLSFRNWMFFLVAFLGWTWYVSIVHLQWTLPPHRLD